MVKVGQSTMRYKIQRATIIQLEPFTILCWPIFFSLQTHICKTLLTRFYKNNISKLTCLPLFKSLLRD